MASEREKIDYGCFFDVHEKIASATIEAKTATTAASAAAAAIAPMTGFQYNVYLNGTISKNNHGQKNCVDQFFVLW